jgi:hypothetical protein
MIEEALLAAIHDENAKSHSGHRTGPLDLWTSGTKVQFREAVPR